MAPPEGIPKAVQRARELLLAHGMYSTAANLWKVLPKEDRNKLSALVTANGAPVLTLVVEECRDEEQCSGHGACDSLGGRFDWDRNGRELAAHLRRCASR